MLTSPHLLRYNERVRINGEEADDVTLCKAFRFVEKARSALPLTYFEFGLLAALHIFKQTQLDVLVLEVGLGGRLDATNIVDPDISLITISRNGNHRTRKFCQSYGYRNLFNTFKANKCQKP